MTKDSVKTYSKIVYWIVVFAIPIFVGLGLFNASIHPAFIEWEYGKADFPPDFYGWTQQDRLDLAAVALDYLSRPEPAEEIIFMLEDQVKPGTTDALYNEREIGHMLDVKRVRDNLLVRWSRIAGIFTLIGLIILLYQKETRKPGFQAIMRGGMILTLLLLGIGLFVGLAWDTFFTSFHELLFPPDTWSFPLDDSLIRLFTYKFWYDYGVLITSIVLAGGAITWLLGYLLWRRS